MKRASTILPTAALWFAATMLGALPALPADGKIPIHQVPATIDTPGSYYLTRDLTGASGSALLTISADDVTVDLGGHTIRRTDAGGDVIAASGNPTRVEIRNGRIAGGSRGVHLLNVAGASFDVVLTDLTVCDSAGDGVHVEGGFEVGVPTSIRIERLNVVDSGGRGIAVSWAHSGTVRDNVVRAAALDGIVVEGSTAVTVRDNNSSRNGGDGIEVVGSIATMVQRNHLSFNTGYGLVFSGPTLPSDERNLYSDNRMSRNTAGVVTVTGYNAEGVGGNNYPVP